MPTAERSSAMRPPLQVLLDLTRALAEETTLEASLKVIADAALELVPASHVSIRLLDSSGTALLSGARAGDGATLRPLGFRPGEGLSGWTVSNRRPLLVNDVDADPRFVSLPDQGFRIGSILTEPLWSAGRVVGVLSASSHEKGAFTEEHQLLARLLSNCCIPPLERARLERIAQMDETTLAYRKMHLFPSLATEIERAQATGAPLSVLLMDLDHFKNVNDEHGHAAGDKALRLFADLVRANVRRDDVLVRRGGEEFVLVMPYAAQQQALRTAERIRRTLEDATLVVDVGTAIHQTVSVGVATWNGEESAQALEERADQAMYAAKRAGRNRVMVSEDEEAPPPPSVPSDP